MKQTDPLSPTSTSSAMKTPENIEEDPDDPEPANEKRYPNGILLLLAVQLKCRSRNKKLCVRIYVSVHRYI
jgi:hypothetical protein